MIVPSLRIPTTGVRMELSSDLGITFGLTPTKWGAASVPRRREEAPPARDVLSAKEEPCDELKPSDTRRAGAGEGSVR
jgi:hypothetical protein